MSWRVLQRTLWCLARLCFMLRRTGPLPSLQVSIADRLLMVKSFLRINKGTLSHRKVNLLYTKDVAEATPRLIETWNTRVSIGLHDCMFTWTASASVLVVGLSTRTHTHAHTRWWMHVMRRHTFTVIQTRSTLRIDLENLSRRVTDRPVNYR